MSDLIVFFLRSISIGMLLPLCVLLLAQRPKAQLTHHTLFFSLSWICFLLVQGAEQFSVAVTQYPPVEWIAAFVYLLSWRMGMVMLGEEQIWHSNIGKAFIATTSLLIFLDLLGDVGLVEQLDTLPKPMLKLVESIYFTLCLFMMAHLVYCAIKGKAEDLHETHRKYRTSVAICFATVLSMMLVSRLIHVLDLFDTSYIWLFVPSIPVCVTLWLVDLRQALYPQRALLHTPKTVNTPATQKTPAHLDALFKQITQHKIYHQHGLTLAKLATHMTLPERTLRALINKELGYNNFSDFLASHRIEEAKQRLASSNDANTPVLTIALEVGFSSISPFNAAFKSRVGVTPTQYRKASLREGTSETESINAINVI